MYIGGFLTKAALWILKLRENHKLPVSTVVEILANVQELYLFLLWSLHAELKGTVSANEALSAVNEASKYDIFDDLKTSYNQEKYFKENFRFAVSKPYACCFHGIMLLRAGLMGNSRFLLRLKIMHLAGVASISSVQS